MRKELKALINAPRYLDIYEFDMTISIIDSLLESRNNEIKNQLDEMEKKAIENNEIDNENSGYNEAVSDIAYYHWLDNHYLFQFALWRLQAVFEGLLKQEFFLEKDLIGLKTKLKEVRKQGFTINDKDYNELIEWGDLRNSLSHFPFDKYQSIDLNYEDIVEYKNLVSKVANELYDSKVK